MSEPASNSIDNPTDERSAHPLRATDRVRWERLAAGCRVARFRSGAGSEEVHLHLEPDRSGSFEDQLQQLVTAYHETLATLGLGRETSVFRRCHLSDAANQLEATMASPLGFGVSGDEVAAVSCVEQPPLPYHKLALHAYHVDDVRPGDKRLVRLPAAGPHAHCLELLRGEYRMLWTAQMALVTERSPEPCREQTRRLFDAYRELLGAHGATLRDDVLRTWLFVHDVDNQYAAMVAERRTLFGEEGLTPGTHYLVSTGIEGRWARPDCLVVLDAWAMPGLGAEQLRYLDALDHLNRTSDYGVTFERAARLEHGDRAHLLLSGTASIDALGQVVHPGDVLRQTERTLENIRALLATGGASLDDMAEMTVYLRDPADAAAVRERLDAVSPALPYLMVHAPVCRPGWLIEIEGIAIVPSASSWPRF